MIPCKDSATKGDLRVQNKGAGAPTLKFSFSFCLCLSFLPPLPYETRSYCVAKAGLDPIL